MLPGQPNKRGAGGGNGNTPRPGANVASPDPLSTNVLAAIEMEDLEELDKLVKGGWNPTQILPNDHYAIEFAVEGNKKRSIQWLFEHDVDLDQPGRSGYSPLGLAMAQANPELIVFLLKLGASPFSPPIRTTNAGRTALEDALQKNNEAVTAAFFEGGVDPNTQIRGMILFEYMVEYDLYNSLKGFISSPHIDTSKIEECAKNGGFDEKVTKIILERIGFIEKLPSKGVPLITRFIRSPLYTGESPPAGPDQIIQEVVDPEEWKIVTKSITKHALTNCICGDSVNSDYLVRTIQNETILDFILLSFRADTREIVSFALCKIIQPNTLYIDIVCAKQKYKGFGTIMMGKLKGLQKLFRIPLLSLNSVAEREGFYALQGFQRTPDKNKPLSGLLAMTYTHPNVPPVAVPAAAGGGAANAAPEYSFPPAPPSPPAGFPPERVRGSRPGTFRRGVSGGRRPKPRRTRKSHK